MFSIAILGGILLNIGAYFTMKGWIYRSVSVYILADFCWVIMAVEHGDTWGIVFITSGTIFGIIALYKMYQGRMNKNL